MTLTPMPGGGGEPPMPEWNSLYSDPLDIASATEEWGVVIREMQEAGTLSVANGHAIKRLVMFRLEYERSSREVVEHGAVLLAKRTKVQQANVHWVVMRQADEAIRVLEAELGLPPVRRAKAGKVQKKAKTDSAAQKYLKLADRR